MSENWMRRIAEEENLYAAWCKVQSNRGAAGTDAVSVGMFGQRWETHLGELRMRLLEDTYYPLPLRRVSIPKRDGGLRDLAIPTVADRVVQRAFVNVLEEHYEQIFLDCSFAYRPERSVQQAVERTLQHKEEGYPWILDADVERFFASIPHRGLIDRLRETIPDPAVLRTISMWLEAGILAGEGEAGCSAGLLQEAANYVRAVSQSVVDEVLGHDQSAISPAYPENEEAELDAVEREKAERKRTLVRFGRDAVLLAASFRSALLPLLRSRAVRIGGGIGVLALGAGMVGQYWLQRRAQSRLQVGAPQGSPLSPLLANVYLHSFDHVLTNQGLRLVRYADDFVVCCCSETRARHARQVAGQALGRLRLQLNENKTRIVGCEDTFVFLGHEFDVDGAFALPPRNRRDQARTAVQTVQRGFADARQRMSHQRAGNSSREQKGGNGGAGRDRKQEGK